MLESRRLLMASLLGAVSDIVMDIVMPETGPEDAPIAEPRTRFPESDTILGARRERDWDVTWGKDTIRPAPATEDHRDREIKGLYEELARVQNNLDREDTMQHFHMRAQILGLVQTTTPTESPDNVLEAVEKFYNFICYGDTVNRQEQAYLGLATNAELTAEIAARYESGNIAPEYRTVDPQPEPEPTAEERTGLGG